MTRAERMRRDGWRLMDGFGVWQGRHAGLVVDVRVATDDRDAAACAFHHSHERATDRVLDAHMDAQHGLRSLAQRAKAAARKLARERGRS